jgi:hypothetical protein
MLFGVQEPAVPRASAESVAGLKQQDLAPVVMRAAATPAKPPPITITSYELLPLGMSSPLVLVTGPRNRASLDRTCRAETSEGSAPK